MSGTAGAIPGAATSLATVQGQGMGVKNQMVEEFDGVPFIRPR